MFMIRPHRGLQTPLPDGAEITITQSVSRRTCPFTQLFDNFLILGWVEGFEPSATGTTIQRSTS